MKRIAYRQPPEIYLFHGKRFARLRKKCGYTLEELSIKTGINPFTLSRYSTGASTPKTPNIAFILADALECDVFDLFVKKENRHIEVNL